MADVEATYPPAFTKNDTFEQKGSGDLDSPAYRAFQITPTNASNLSVAVRGIYVGGDGNVFCRMAGGNATHTEANAFFHQVKAGTILPVREICFILVHWIIILVMNIFTIHIMLFSSLEYYPSC